MAPETKTWVIFDPHTKPSQFLSRHWNQVISDLPHWNHVYFDHPYNNQIKFDHLHNNRVNFDANTKNRVILGQCYFACYTYQQYMFLWYSSSNTYNIVTSTNSYSSWGFHTTVKPRKYCGSIYRFFLLHGIYTTTCGTGGRTSLLSIPPIHSSSWCHT